MSYVGIQPSFYEMNYPETPWHAGAPGWSTEPSGWGWGQNPNQRGPRFFGPNGLKAPDQAFAAQRIAPRNVSGLGCACGVGKPALGQSTAMAMVGPIGLLAVMGGMLYILSQMKVAPIPEAPRSFRANQPVGSGERFARLQSKLGKRRGVRDPRALAAWIGRRKYGKRRFQQLAAAGRRRRAARPYAQAA